MSTQVEERVVGLRFDNKTFEKDVRQTTSALDKLNYSVEKLKGGAGTIANGVTLFASKLKSITFDPIAKGAEMSMGKIMALTAALTGVSNVTTEIYNKTTQLIKSMSSDQVTAGWKKYEDYTQSVQTILSATRKDGEEAEDALERVNNQLERLLWFTDETSYNLTDMTSNIGKFTSQGVELEEAVTAMQGIALWSAAAGQDAPEASRAMYNLSQALGSGSVKLIDWKSIENANMATKEVKQLAIEAGVAHGTLKKVGEDITTLGGDKVTFENFNTTLSEGWFNKEVLMDVTNTYGSFANKIREEYLKTGKLVSQILDEIDEETISEQEKIGYNAFIMGQSAITFSQAIESVQDAVSTQFMRIFQAIFGNYLQAKDLWTDFAEELWDIFAGPVGQIADIFERFNELGQANNVINDLWEMWNSVLDIVTQVKDTILEAFGYVADEEGDYTDSIFQNSINFLNKFQKKFHEIRVEFGQFVKRFLDRDDIWENVSIFFEGLKSAGSILKNLTNTLINRLINPIAGKTNDIFYAISKIFGKIGEGLIWLDDYIKATDLFNSFFNNMDKVVQQFFETVKQIKKTIKKTLDDLFKHNKGGNKAGMPSQLTNMVDTTKEVINVADLAGDKIVMAIDSIGNAIDKSMPFIITLWNWIKKIFQDGKKFIDQLVKWLKDFKKQLDDNLFTPMLENLAGGAKTNMKNTSLLQWLTDSNGFIDTFKKVMSVITYAIEYFKNLKAAQKELDSGSESDKDGITALADWLTNFFDTFQPVMEKAAKMLNIFTGSKSLLDALIKMTWHILLQVLVLVYGINLIKERFPKPDENDAELSEAENDKAWWQKLLGIPTDGFVKLKAVISELKDTLEMIGKIGIKIANVMATIITMITIVNCLVLLIASLVVLSTMPWQNLLISLGVIIVTVAVIISIYKFLSIGVLDIISNPMVASGKFATGMLAIGGFFTLFATAILEIAMALFVIASIPDTNDHLMGKIVGITILLGAAMGIAYILARFDDSFNTEGLIAGGVVVLMLAKAVQWVAAAMYKISKIEENKFGQALEAVLLIIALLGGIDALASALVNDQTAFQTIISMGVLTLMMATSVIAIALAMTKIGKIPDDELKKAGITMAVIWFALGAFVAGATVLANWLGKGGDAIVALSLMAGIIVIISAAMIAIGFAIKQVAKGLPNVDAIGHIAGAMSLMIGVIAAIITAMAKFISLDENMIITLGIAGTMMTMVLSTVAMVFEAISKLINKGMFDPAKMWEAVGIMSAFIVVLVVIMGVITVLAQLAVNSKFGTGFVLTLMVVIIVISAFVAAVGLAASGIAMLIDAITDLAKVSDQAKSKIANNSGTIIGAMTGIISSVVDGFEEIIEKKLAKKKENKIAKALINFVDTLLNGILDKFLEGSIIEKFRRFLTKLTQNIKHYLDDNLEDIKEAVDMILSAMLEIIIHLLDEYGPQIIEKLDTLIQDMLERIRHNISFYGKAIVLHIRNILEHLMETLKTFRDGLLDLIFGTLLMALKDIRKIAFEIGYTINSIILLIVDGIIKAIDVHGPEIIEHLVVTAINLVNALATSIEDHDKDIVDAVNHLLEAVYNTFVKWVNTNTQPGGKMYNAGGNLVTGMINGIKSKLPSLNAFMTNLSNSSVLGPVLHTLGINSPSKEFFGIGVNIDEGLMGGIFSGLAKLKDLMAGLAQTVFGTFTESFGDPKAIIEKFTGGLLDGVSGSFSGMFDINSMLGDITNLTPVITPQLDLSQLEEQAGKIDGLIDTSQIEEISASFGASTIGLDSVSLKNGLDDMMKKMQNYMDVKNYNNTQPIDVNVVLDGDAKKMLKVVKVENNKQYKATGVDQLAHA